MSDLPPNIVAELARRRLNLQEQAGTSRRRLEETYGLNREDIGRTGQEGVRNINDQFAGRGLFNSGIRVNEQGQLSRNIAERYSDLERTKGRGLEDIQRALTTGLGDIESYGAEQARVYGAQRLQEQLQQQQMAAQQAQLEAMANASAGQSQGVYYDPGPSTEELLMQLLQGQQEQMPTTPQITGGYSNPTRAEPIAPPRPRTRLRGPQ